MSDADRANIYDAWVDFLKVQNEREIPDTQALKEGGEFLMGYGFPLKDLTDAICYEEAQRGTNAIFSEILKDVKTLDVAVMGIDPTRPVAENLSWLTSLGRRR